MMGILLGQMPSLSEEVIHRLESIALGIFAPIFFATAGLKVNVASLLEPRLFGFALLILAIACIGKISGAYLGARLLGKRDHWTALSFGAALNARGAVEIIIATIGLSLGILTQEIFSMIVLMAITTSLIAPVMMRWAFSRVVISPEEQERLRREAVLKDNLIASVHRVLVPVRLRESDNMIDPVQTIEAGLLKRLSGQTDIAITLLTVASADDKARATEFLNRLAPLFGRQHVNKKVLISNNAGNAILDEAAKGYELLILGAPREGTRTDVLFTPLVDYLVRLAPCPTIVIHGSSLSLDWTPCRILVPTNGSVAARRAAEVGFVLVPRATDSEEHVRILQVVPEEKTATYPSDVSGRLRNRQLNIAHQIVNELAMLGDSFGVHTVPEVVTGNDPETVILERARTGQIDLIILGISVRAASTRLYLGRRVERILQDAPCPVMIVNTVGGATVSLPVESSVNDVQETVAAPSTAA
ncbi:MAG: universal stress protein [Chloroflexaceae bacterium]|nr:universal stress protein [Chloroflexaceae bacterium]